MGCGRLRRVICTLWAAGVLGAGGVLAEQWWAHLRLTQHSTTVTGALCTGVNVPSFPFHKVLSSRGVANRRGAELRLLHYKVICAGRAALSGTNGGVAAARHGTGDESAHFLSVVTVAFPATIMPALLVLMMMAIHGQTCA